MLCLVITWARWIGGCQGGGTLEMHGLVETWSCQDVGIPASFVFQG